MFLLAHTIVTLPCFYFPLEKDLSLQFCNWKHPWIFKVLQQAAQRRCECPDSGGVQSQVDWDSGQPGLVLNVEVGGPACGGGGGGGDS